MRTVRLALAATLMLWPALLRAQSGAGSYLQPSISVLGTSEHGSGAAYAPPRDGLKRDDAASVALGLDGRTILPGGRLEASLFALAHDPLSADDRGLYFAGRARGSFGGNSSRWILRFEDSARVQRRDTPTLSDFQRNEIWLELERATALSGPNVSLRIGDRRRSVRGEAIQDFDRQALLGAVTWGGPERRVWRLEVGPQRYSTDAAQGWRLVGGFEMVGTFGASRTALRFTWTEPLRDLIRGVSGVGEPTTLPVPPPLPPTTPTPGSPVGPSRSPILREGLLGPSLVVDPLESDEGDWDFGRRKQEIVALASRRLGGHFWVTAEMRAQLERGPDLTAAAPERASVRRERLSVRLHLRRELNDRTALVAQGGWQSLHDNRPGLSFSRGLVCLGVELRP